MTRDQYLHRIGIPLAATICILGLSVAGISWRYQNRVYPGVSAGEIRLGEKDLREALTELTAQAEVLESRLITLSYQEIQVETTLQDLGISLDPDQTLIRSYRAKRSYNPLELPWALLGEKTIDWAYTLNQETFDSAFPASIRDQLPAAENARLTYQNGEVSIVPEVIGLSIAWDDFADRLVQKVGRSETTVPVPTVSKTPETTTAVLTELLPKIRTMASDHTITHNDDDWTIGAQEVLDWIFVEDGTIRLSSDKIKAFLDSIEPEVNQDPKDATVRFDTEQNILVATTPSQTGQTLMKEESNRRIQQDILAKRDATDLFVSQTKPTIYEGTLSELGIVELIASGTSDFRGSPPNRVHNIKVNADRTSGTVLAPGEEFSFVSKMGPVNAATGYLPELVIKGNRTIPEYGGGICQVSSTLFRAALDSTLDITERQAHSYVVSYYGTPGLDATIYTPRPDFRFKNTTDHHVLLQHRIEGTVLTYELYGTKPPIESRIVGPTVLQSSPDGSMRTVVKRELYKDGELLDTNAFYSNYRPPNRVTANPLE